MTTIHFTYDQEGRKTEEREVGTDSLEHKKTYRYTNLGFVESRRDSGQVEFIDPGTKKMTFSDRITGHSFMYPKVDSHGNWLSQLEFVKGTVVIICSRKIEYY